MSTAYEITVHDLHQQQSRLPEWRVIDVREPWELDICALPFADHVPLGSLPSATQHFDVKQPLIIVCHKGVRSLKATLWLQQQGFAARSLRGGIAAWAEEIDRTMARY